MEKITAEIRVTTLKVQPFSYKDDKDDKGEMVGGEALEMRAAGFWVGPYNDDHFPISLHMITYPGHEIVPAIGDCVSISIERSK